MHPSPVNLRPLAGPLLVAGATTAVVFAAGLLSAHALFGPPRSAADRESCGLPAGITSDALDPLDLSYALRRGFLCADHLAGRIPGDQYRLRLALLDDAHRLAVAADQDDDDDIDGDSQSDADERMPDPASEPSIEVSEVDTADSEPEIEDSAPDSSDDRARVAWATTVRAFSTQYTGSDWSAARALGAPDVPAGGGDHANAWASESADDRVEFLEVGFDHRPRHVRGIDIVETHNAGAVTRVELIAEDGTRTTAYSGPAHPTASPFRRHIPVACTAKRIVAVRVTLDSAAVPDWNEIDAIGLRPCTP